MIKRHAHRSLILRRYRLKVRLDFLCLTLLCLIACAIVSGVLQSKAYGENNAIDICREIPGVTVARAVGGNLTETKSMPGRCVYIVDFGKSGTPGRAFVVYRHNAEEYDSLKAAMDGEARQLKGLGDEAVVSFDKEAGRYWLLALRKGQATYQISGNDEQLVRKIAEAVLQ